MTVEVDGEGHISLYFECKRGVIALAWHRFL